MLELVANVCRTTVLERAWETNVGVQVHGWVYGLDDGQVRPLTPPVRSPHGLNC